MFGKSTTLNEISRTYGGSYQLWYNQIVRQGRFPFFRIGRKILVPVTSFRNILFSKYQDKLEDAAIEAQQEIDND